MSKIPKVGIPLQYFCVFQIFYNENIEEKNSL